MKKQHFKGVLASTLALSILLSPALYVRSSAAAPTENLKDHWSFEGDTPLVSTVQDGATATLQGEHVSVVDSGNPVFGKVLRFGEGTDNYMRLENYINTGSGSTSFSMWYRYDTSITGDVAAVETGVEAGRAVAEAKGLMVDAEVIPSPSDRLVPSVL